MKLLTLFLLALFALVAAKDCLNSCSQHGRCDTTTGFCQCNTGWAGTDCSLPFTPLASNEDLPNQNVEKGAWRYYRIRTYSDHSLRVSIEQQSATMDVDLYLLAGGIPSISNWSYANFDLAQNFEVTVENPGDAIWYIGAYGYTASTFSITAVVGSLCTDLNNCNGHGTCAAPNVCLCSEGWTGNDCSQQYQRIVPGTPINGVSLQDGKWMFFQYNLGNRNDFTVIVNQSAATSDVDLYLRFGSAPTLFEFDYRDAGIQQNFQITVTEPRLGLWWIGAYAYKGGTFNIQIPSAVSACPNKCSNHGTCQAGGCLCNSGFEGTGCETMTGALSPNVGVNGYVNTDAWNFYHAIPASTENLVLTVNQTSTEADCDLYVKSGEKPTRISFDYAHFGFEKDYQLIIEDPGIDTWFIGVYGYKECNFTLTSGVTQACPGSPPCSNHGTCTSGTCRCNTGYSGLDCSSADSGSLTNGGPAMAGQIQGGEHWNFYTFTVTQPTTYLAFDLKEKATQGQLWVFVAKGNQAPTLTSYDFANHDTAVSIHRIAQALSSPQTGTWTVGVYSNPFSYPDEPVDYSLTAWASPF